MSTPINLDTPSEDEPSRWGSVTYQTAESALNGELVGMVEGGLASDTKEQIPEMIKRVARQALDALEMLEKNGFSAFINIQADLSHTGQTHQLWPLPWAWLTLLTL